MTYPDGATPLSEEESTGLIPDFVSTQGQLDEAERNNIADALTWLSGRRLVADRLLTMEFARLLHVRMFGATWKWAGRFRTTGKNIGVPAEQISMRLHELLADTRHQLAASVDPVDEIALRFHHRLVQIHPFPNGNGRHARLLTDCLLRASGGAPFSWGRMAFGDEVALRTAYIGALRAADGGDFSGLRGFVRS